MFAAATITLRESVCDNKRDQSGTLTLDMKFKLDGGGMEISREITYITNSKQIKHDWTLNLSHIAFQQLGLLK